MHGDAVMIYNALWPLMIYTLWVINVGAITDRPFFAYTRAAKDE